MTFELVKLVSRFKVNLRQLKFYILSFIYRKGTYDIKNNYSILIKKKNDVNKSLIQNVLLHVYHWLCAW